MLNSYSFTGGGLSGIRDDGLGAKEWVRVGFGWNSMTDGWRWACNGLEEEEATARTEVSLLYSQKGLQKTGPDTTSGHIIVIELLTKFKFH